MTPNPDLLEKYAGRWEKGVVCGRRRFMRLLGFGSCIVALPLSVPEGLKPLPAPQDREHLNGAPVIRTEYHLTVRPWKPLNISREKYLESIEGICRFSVQHQDSNGAIIDPFVGREFQYSTPYFAYAVGTLVAAGHARDLLPNGVRAMEHSTLCFAGGLSAIPDQHGNFFIPALTGALSAYDGLVPKKTMDLWRERLKKPLDQVVNSENGNWGTYTMLGEWMRVLAGLADRNDTISMIEEFWWSQQRLRMDSAPWYLYHDRSSNPDTLSVEAVGRGNLLALVNLGYDGPSAEEMREMVEAGTQLALSLQDPSGQAPANGRCDDHVWVDVGFQFGFEIMAERAYRQNKSWMAGQFRRAGMLSFQNISRWRRTDGPWSGSYYVTKNQFDPRLRVGYQSASQYSNYNGDLMFHLSESYQARASTIRECPTPAEIGGYALVTDQQFGSVFANAGGVQMQANLRGQITKSDSNLWTPLGVVRFARMNWDTRLGPSDGALTQMGGVTFAPEFFENGRWLRMADLSSRYEGAWNLQFVHPLLVRCAISYRPKTGETGPTFRNEFTLTPDGILSVVRKTSPREFSWGVTWPLLKDDGTPLVNSITAYVASVGYAETADQQNFIALDPGSELALEPVLRSTYGDLQPVRVMAPGKTNCTFIYPRVSPDPAAETVRRSFVLTSNGFRCVLGRVYGSLYVGRTAAGGFGREIDLDDDRKADASFSQPCGFLLQIEQGKVLSVETDRPVTAQIQGKRVALECYQPVALSPSVSGAGSAGATRPGLRRELSVSRKVVYSEGMETEI